MPRSNRKSFNTLNSSTQRKIRRLEANIISETLNNSLNSNTSSNKSPLSNEPTSEIIEMNFSHISKDANLSNDSDPEEISSVSSSEKENNKFLPLFEQEFLNNNEDDGNTDTEKNDFKRFFAS